MPAYPYVQSPGLLIAAIVALVIGVLLKRWSSRNSMTSLMADSAKSAAFAAVRSGKVPQMPAELGAKIADFQAEKTNVGRAKKAAGYGFRHFLAQIFGLVGLIAILGGLMLGVLSLFWR